MKKIAFIVILIYSFSTANAQEYLYDEAYDVLNEILLDSTKYSFKKAVLTVEHAYRPESIDTMYISEHIKMLANLSHSVSNSRTLKAYEFSDKDKVLNYASLFTVMTDTLKINRSGKEFEWLPFRYDFDDVWGDEDWTNMFVSKLLDTKKGNCHSLPYLYKMIAEELNIEAHLALAPNHIYIKHKNEKDGWYNTELTSGIFPNDAWIMASGYTHLDGIRNGLYMKPLTNQESIALTLIDLAEGYEKKFPMNNGEFVVKCVDTALKYFPNYTNALLMKLENYKKELQFIAKENGKQINEISHIPKAQKIWGAVNGLVRHIHELGYRQMPKGMYLDWLVSLKEEKEKYTNEKISTFNKSN